MKVRVYYEDTDMGGIVYHSKYINFCERARSELLFERGLSPHKEDGFFVVKEIKALFFYPAKLGDILTVKSEVKWIKSASFLIRQVIFKDDIKVFEMDVLLVQVDMGGKVKKIDKKMKQLLNDLSDI